MAGGKHLIFALTYSYNETGTEEAGRFEALPYVSQPGHALLEILLILRPRMIV